MVVKRNALIYIMLFSLFIFLSNIIVFYLDMVPLSALYVIGHFAVIEFILFVVFNSKIVGRKLNFGTIFSLVLFIFHFGQLVLYTYFQGVYSHIRFLLLLSSDDALYGFKMINLSFTLICLGILWSSAKVEYAAVTGVRSEKNNCVDLEKLAKLVILVTFPVKVGIDLVCLFVSITQGGTAARIWMNVFPNIFLYYGKISLIGFALLLIIYKEYAVKQKRVFCFIELYILIMMVSGIRSENVGYLLVFMFIYFYNRAKKMRITATALYTVIGFFALSFIVGVGNFRVVDDKSLYSFLNVIVEAFTKKNVLLSLLDTLGDTGYTAQCVLNKWLPVYGPSYGDSYYLGWTAIIPNIPGINDLPGKLTQASSFALKLQKSHVLSEYYTNIGGSLVGELFFNFGIIGGPISSFIIGAIIGWINRKSSYLMEIDDYYKMIKYIPIMFASIYWVRDYFGGGIREVVWGPVLCFIVYRFLKNKSIRTKVQA